MDFFITTGYVATHTSIGQSKSVPLEAVFQRL